MIKPLLTSLGLINLCCSLSLAAQAYPSEAHFRFSATQACKDLDTGKPFEDSIRDITLAMIDQGVVSLDELDDRTEEFTLDLALATFQKCPQYVLDPQEKTFLEEQLQLRQE